MDRDVAKVDLKRKINEFIEEQEDRSCLLGSETVDLMANAALAVLFAVDGHEDYLTNEGIVEWM